jgi:hypothetical protein
MGSQGECHRAAEPARADDQNPTQSTRPN